MLRWNSFGLIPLCALKTRKKVEIEGNPASLEISVTERLEQSKSFSACSSRVLQIYCAIDIPKVVWKNSANTELQYAVRVHSIAAEYSDVDFTAIGYVTKGNNVEFSNEIKTANYAELNK